ncbi:hypothetical protein DPMN_049397 [Dreissena polymorpha]|uniref:Uncharacterized protein n=1 Tax=Dreissena polymorpha TaxID=45954 RepID=A0A9D4CFU2_DREPO|nr:hypothetical protein DPMN_049397 [Dreissena polymorpha]
MDRCPLCFGTFQRPKLLLCLDTMFFTHGPVSTMFRNLPEAEASFVPGHVFHVYL